MKYYFGVDIGGTNIRIGVMDEDFKLVKVIKESSKDIKTQEDLMNKITSLYNRCSEYSCSALGIGVCGPCNKDTGIAYFIPNMNLENVDFNVLNLGVPTFIGNDANVACLAESLLGAGKGKGVVQYITLSTGVGGGLFVNGNLITGKIGYAQEIGHIKVKEGGAQQNKFTAAGSLESTCSGTSLTRRANELGFKAAHAGEVFQNPECKDLIDEYVQDVCDVMINIAYFIEPEVFIIGGGVSKSFDYFKDELIKRFNEQVFDGLKNKIEIKKALLDQDTGIYGSCLLGKYYLEK